MPGTPQVVVNERCPPLKKYPSTTTKAVAEELQRLLKDNPKSPSASMLRDYRVLRDACRAIEGK